MHGVFKISIRKQKSDVRGYFCNERARADRTCTLKCRVIETDRGVENGHYGVHLDGCMACVVHLSSNRKLHLRVMFVVMDIDCPGVLVNTFVMM